MAKDARESYRDGVKRGLEWGEGDKVEGDLDGIKGEVEEDLDGMKGEVEGNYHGVKGEVEERDLDEVWKFMFKSHNY